MIRLTWRQKYPIPKKKEKFNIENQQYKMIQLIDVIAKDEKEIEITADLNIGNIKD
jgi:hypothetical protein